MIPTESRPEFCLALKAARERKGITLDQIAATTKIPAFLFEGLERNDLRRWPKGLFRRSFFRDYARTIDLPVVEACAAFARLFPDEETAELTKAPDEESGDLLTRVRAALPALRSHWANAIANMFSTAGDDTPEPIEEPPPQKRAWVSDARRVSSAPAPRLRVRIKVS